MPYNYFGYNAYNQYMPTGYNPYSQNQARPQEQYQPTQPNQPMQFQRPAGIQGKIVDNMDVVKAIEIPLDGSTSYFPLATNTEINKHLQLQDKILSENIEKKLDRIIEQNNTIIELLKKE